MLLVPEGVYLTPENFLLKTPMQGRQNEGGLRNLSMSHCVTFPNRMNLNFGCQLLTVHWQAAQLHQAVDFRPGKII